MRPLLAGDAIPGIHKAAGNAFANCAWRSQRLTDALERLVEQFDEDEALLLDPSQLRQRMEALDLLDSHLPDAHFPDASFSDASQPKSAAASNTTELYRRARAIYARLEAVNCELYEGIRGEIRRGGRPDALPRWTASSAEMDDVPGPANGMGYDYLDELISGVFQFDEPDAEPVRREAEMVLYQPTPARHIFHLIGLIALTATDVLVDLGSGLGHVPLLAAILTCARSIGIELEATYVERARQCAQRLNLNRVTFIQQDARAADLSAGTVFYLYTPFTGSILSSVLSRLRREAAIRPIRICTYGPCTSVIAGESWLEATAAPVAHRIALFRSRA
jgi:Methyltransferase domain